MRSPRTLLAILTMVLAVTGAVATPVATARTSGATAAAGEEEPGEEPAEITVTATIKKMRVRPYGPRQLVITGTVDPMKGPVWIQRATRCNKDKGTCNYTFYKKRFLQKGRYSAVVDAPPTQRGWVFRAKVKDAYSEAWLTCTKRDSQKCKVPY